MGLLNSPCFEICTYLPLVVTAAFSRIDILIKRLVSSLQLYYGQLCRYFFHISINILTFLVLEFLYKLFHSYFALFVVAYGYVHLTFIFFLLYKLTFVIGFLILFTYCAVVKSTFSVEQYEDKRKNMRHFTSVLVSPGVSLICFLTIKEKVV